MNDLAQMHCSPINSSSMKLSETEIDQQLNRLSDWLVIDRMDEPRLEKVFKFQDFHQALSFTNLVAQESEKENHHPAILTEWAKVTVGWWTHKIKGLHMNDYIMAAKTDRLYRTASKQETK